MRETRPNNRFERYGDRELIELFRFSRVDLFELIDELSSLLEHVANQNSALSLSIVDADSTAIFYANCAFQNTCRGYDCVRPEMQLFIQCWMIQVMNGKETATGLYNKHSPDCSVW